MSSTKADQPLEAIGYTVEGKFAIITLNQPESLNALNNDQYLLLGCLVEQANNNPDTCFTLIQSTGRYFSAGANVKDSKLGAKEFKDEFDERNYWLSKFTARNAYLTTVFHNHRKVLIAALNGPVVGLSTALVSLCDFIYAMNDKVFILAPFANLGLVSEGVASATLINRLGLSIGNEALLLSKPISAPKLEQTGYLNKNFKIHNRSQADVDRFNSLVKHEFWDMAKNLEFQSIIDIKKIIQSNLTKNYRNINAQEIIDGVYKWLDHVPQQKFAKIAGKQLKHKL